MIMTMSVDGTTDDKWHLSHTGRVIITVIFASIILVGVLGNILVITIIVLVKKLQSTVNLCLVFLALIDLVVMVFLPINPWHDLYGKDHFLFGRHFCKSVFHFLNFIY